MLITAQWILPVSRPPIRDGAVLVHDGHVVAVGPADDIAALDPLAARYDFGECIITPGLVNAHTHLSLTSLNGLVPPGPFHEWLPQLVRGMHAWSADEFAASATLGAYESLRSGVTVVGDIVYERSAAEAIIATGLGGTFYWEVLGIEAPALFGVLEQTGFPAPDDDGCGPRSRCGLSPHATYSSGARLLQLVHGLALETGAPVAIHVAESAAETQLFRDGTGPLAPLAERLAHGFEAPGVTPVAYLDGLGVLDGATAIHLGHATPSDVSRLAATARGTVACPRSNAYLHNPIAPVQDLLDAGIPVGIGTDSSASNHDLDLMADVRALHREQPEVDCDSLLKAVTLMGAIALGVEDRYGVIEKGMQADLAVFRTGPTDDPTTAFVSHAGAQTLEALLVGGSWRALDGSLCEDLTNVEARASAAAQKARDALA